MKKNLNQFLASRYLAPLLILAAAQAQAAAPAAPGRVAELSLHRMENLVILKKIQPSHVNNLHSLTLTAVPHSTDEEAAYQVVANQYPATDGSESTLLIPLRADGKALKHTETLAGESASAPKWPALDAVTLSENALHCIQGEIVDNARPQLCTSPELTVYNHSFSSLVLSQDQDETGPVAVVDIRAQGTPRVLRVRLKSDGIPVANNPVVMLEE
jgi:hypothetical protein